MNTPEKVAMLFGQAGLETVRGWVERVERNWDLERFVVKQTTFGASKRKLESLTPPARNVFLERARKVMSRLSPEDFLYRGAAVCAIARRPS